MKSNIFIDALLYGKKKLEEKSEFSLEDIISELKKNHDAQYITFVLPEIIKEKFVKNHDKYRINVEGYFNLLNQENLEIANKGLDLSNRSLKAANMGLLIAFLGLALSIFLACWSIFQTPVAKFSDKQFNELKAETSKINQSLNKIISQDSVRYNTTEKKIFQHLAHKKSINPTD